MKVIYGGLGLLALLFLSQGASNDSRDRWGNTIYRSTSLLLPGFANRVGLLLSRLEARGFRPRVYETYRTPQRALMLSTSPEQSGIKNSMHILRAAVDVIDAVHGWKNPAFFKALGEEAEALGLTWGGRFSRVDMPHVQAIPFAAQSRFAAMSEGARDTFVRGLYAA